MNLTFELAAQPVTAVGVTCWGLLAAPCWGLLG
jgi:hypothetical protein